MQAHKQLKIGEDETAPNRIILIIAEDIVTVADATIIGQTIHIVIDHYQVQIRQKTDEKDTEVPHKISTIDDRIINSKEMNSKNLRLK